MILYQWIHRTIFYCYKYLHDVTASEVPDTYHMITVYYIYNIYEVRIYNVLYTFVKTLTKKRYVHFLLRHMHMIARTSIKN